MSLLAIAALSCVVILTVLVLVAISRTPTDDAAELREVYAQTEPPPVEQPSTHVLCAQCNRPFTARGITRHINSAHRAAVSP